MYVRSIWLRLMLLLVVLIPNTSVNCMCYYTYMVPDSNFFRSSLCPHPLLCWPLWRCQWSCECHCELDRVFSRDLVLGGGNCFCGERKMWRTSKKTNEICYCLGGKFQNLGGEISPPKGPEKNTGAGHWVVETVLISTSSTSPPMLLRPRMEDFWTSPLAVSHNVNWLVSWHAGYKYNITVRGVNCGSQEGSKSEHLTIRPQGEFTAGHYTSAKIHQCGGEPEWAANCWFINILSWHTQ